MTLGETRAAPAPEQALASRFRWSQGVLEIVLIGGLYIVYSASRLIADRDFAPAHAHATTLLHLEQTLHLDWESTLNRWFVDDRAVAVFGSFWYATTHYVVTLIVLVWLFGRGPRAYLPARRALVIGTVIALAAYLSLPTCPPRLYGGYVDILKTTADVGWWGADASAPKGLGDLTNELAAFPSLHAGWALWVAIVLWTNCSIGIVRYLGWVYAMTTAVVIVGTANHWVLDVVVGWAVVAVGFWIAHRLPAGRFYAERPRPGIAGSPGRSESR